MFLILHNLSFNGAKASRRPTVRIQLLLLFTNTRKDSFATPEDHAICNLYFWKNSLFYKLFFRLVDQWSSFFILPPASFQFHKLRRKKLKRKLSVWRADISFESYGRKINPNVPKYINIGAWMNPEVFLHSPYGAFRDNKLDNDVKDIVCQLWPFLKYPGKASGALAKSNQRGKIKEISQ